MTSEQTFFNTNGITSLIHQAGPVVTHAIEKAASATGVDFSYLMKKASVESGFDADAKSKTSSARGLYQFLDKTWMSMVKKYGDKYGMGNLADQIDDNGHCASGAVKQQILSLRDDPEKSACLAAEYDAENKDYLAQHADSAGGATDLYLAHFMGAGAAAGFLNSMKDNPLQSAAALFPKAAAANHNVFYNANGGAKSLAQVYSFFSAKFKGDGAPVAAASANETDGVMDSLQNLASLTDSIRTGGESQNAVLSMGAISPIGGSATRVHGGGGWSGGTLSPATSVNLHALPLPKLSSFGMLAMRHYHGRG